MFFDKYSELCKKKGKTPTGVAIELNVSRATVNYWKNGNVPKQDTLIKIANYFNVSVDYLLGNSVEVLGKSNSNTNETSEHINIIKIAGRDGSYEERALTDEQLDLFKKMIDALPEITDL